jgi:hypothetical protein
MLFLGDTMLVMCRLSSPVRWFDGFRSGARAGAERVQRASDGIIRVVSLVEEFASRVTYRAPVFP